MKVVFEPLFSISHKRKALQCNSIPGALAVTQYALKTEQAQDPQPLGHCRLLQRVFSPCAQDLSENQQRLCFHWMSMHLFFKYIQTCCDCQVTSVMSDSVQPHRQQPTRLLCPRGFSRQEYWSGLPFPSPWLRLVKYNSTQFSAVAQSCPTPCQPMDYSKPGFPVHHQLLELAQTHVCCQ